MIIAAVPLRGRIPPSFFLTNTRSLPYPCAKHIGSNRLVPFEESRFHMYRIVRSGQVRKIRYLGPILVCQLVYRTYLTTVLRDFPYRKSILLYISKDKVGINRPYRGRYLIFAFSLPYKMVRREASRNTFGYLPEDSFFFLFFFLLSFSGSATGLRLEI